MRSKKRITNIDFYKKYCIEYKKCSVRVKESGQLFCKDRACPLFIKMVVKFHIHKLQGREKVAITTFKKCPTLFKHKRF